MRDFRDAKTMAKSLRQGLSERSIEIGHSEALELIAKAYGFENWNILAARIEAAQGPAEPPGGPLCCSFCGRSQHEVAALVAGPPPHAICDRCVALSENAMQEPEISRRIAEDEAAPLAARPGPSVMAYMRQKSTSQLEAYVASGELMVAYMNAGLDLSAGREPAADRLGAGELERLQAQIAASKGYAAQAFGTSGQQRLQQTEQALTAAQQVLAERAGG